MNRSLFHASSRAAFASSLAAFASSLAALAPFRAAPAPSRAALDLSRTALDRSRTAPGRALTALAAALALLSAGPAAPAVAGPVPQPALSPLPALSPSPLAPKPVVGFDPRAIYLSSSTSAPASTDPRVAERQTLTVVPTEGTNCIATGCDFLLGVYATAGGLSPLHVASSPGYRASVSIVDRSGSGSIHVLGFSSDARQYVAASTYLTYGDNAVTASIEPSDAAPGTVRPAAFTVTIRLEHLPAGLTAPANARALPTSAAAKP